jgi:hypothetical protein
MTITATSERPGTLDILSAGNLVDRLAGLTADELLVLENRLEDGLRVCRAIRRERLALARRDERWRARELNIVAK